MVRGFEELNGLARVIRRRMKEWKACGCSIGVVRKGRLVYEHYLGQRDSKSNLPVTENTLFEIGSCTKAFTAVALGVLVDEGKLAWDKPVRDYLPEFKLKDKMATERCTPVDLLTHRTGLPRHDLLWMHSKLSRLATVKRLRYLGPSQDFRAGFLYNNLMYLAAGALVERLSGQTWEQFVDERILQPLRMRRTTFAGATRRDAEYAIGYDGWDGRVFAAESRWPAGAHHQWMGPCGPAGSIVSNVRDLARWLAWQRKPGDRILKAATLAQIHSPQVVIPGLDEPPRWLGGSYALGWAVRAYHWHRIFEHTGGTAGFSAYVAFMPDLATGVIVLVNACSTPLASIAMCNILDRLLGKKPAPVNAQYRKGLEEGRKQKARKDPNRKQGTHPSLPLKAYVGTFRHRGYGTLEIRAKGKGLRAFFNGVKYRLRHYECDTFRGSRPRFPTKFDLTFEVGDDRRVAALLVNLEATLPSARFSKVKAKGSAP